MEQSEYDSLCKVADRIYGKRERASKNARRARRARENPEFHDTLERAYHEDFQLLAKWLIKHKPTG